jgi:hypothetical protein
VEIVEDGQRHFGVRSRAHGVALVDEQDSRQLQLMSLSSITRIRSPAMVMQG